MSRAFRLVALVVVVGVALSGCQARTAKPPVPPQVSAAGHLSAGKAALAAGDCTRALAELSEALRQTPGLTEPLLYIGICAFKTGDADQGRAALTRAMAADPDSPRPHEALGIAEYGRNRPDAARAALETAVAKGSTNPQTFYYLGNLDMASGNCKGALDAYRRATTLDAAFAPARTEFEAARAYCAKIGAHQ